MDFIPKSVLKWLTPYLSSNIRSPDDGIFGTIVMAMMKEVNTCSIHEGIHRLQLKDTDTFVEIGAGNGDGLITLLNASSQPPNEETTCSVMPKRVVLIEISERFRKELHTIIEQHPEKKMTSRVEIHSEDCVSMPFLDDNSVDKIFGMNVVYFLNPLETYLKEIHRVLKPGGAVVFGCKFGTLPREGEIKEFANVNRDDICNAMKRVGFEVSTDTVLVDGGDIDIKNYVEIIGVKA